MKIVILDAKSFGTNVNFEKFKKFGEIEIFDATKPSEIKNKIKYADIVITDQIIDKEEIDFAKNLKLICLPCTGTDSINLEYAKKKDIVVKNVVGYSTNSVVQHTFAMLFYLLNQSKYYDEYVKNKHWSKSDIFTYIKLPFKEIYGKTFGIIGLGTIGEEVAKVAKAFGCNVIYYSTSGKNYNDKYKMVELNELLSFSEIISIHAPLNEKTKDMLTYNNLQKLQEGSILLNLGRGKIINETDLSKIIDEKKIYVGLDVLENEPIKKSNPLNLVKNKNHLLITPHIGWSSIEAQNRLLNKTIENIESFLINHKTID